MSDFLGTLRTVARQAPLSVGFPSQEECSGLPSPSPGLLPDSGFEPMSPASAALAGDFFNAEHRGSPHARFLVIKTQSCLQTSFFSSTFIFLSA